MKVWSEWSNRLEDFSLSNYVAETKSKSDKAGPAIVGPADGFDWPSLAWLAVALLVVSMLYFDVFVWLWERWQTQDFSHGMFVPLFSCYILWLTFKKGGQTVTLVSSRSVYLGIVLILLGLAIRLTGIYTRVWTLEGLSLPPFILGVIAVLFGERMLWRTLPAVVFLVFMVPLPAFLSNQMGGFLQMVATAVSTFSLQVLGIPAVADGNVITLSGGKIGVAEACSGLRMVYAFFALTVGASLIIDRTWWEKLFIAACAIPIAILVNCVRITATGIAYEYASPEMAERIFHDIAGWLMMPLGFMILVGGLWILDQLIVPAEEQESR